MQRKQSTQSSLKSFFGNNKIESKSNSNLNESSLNIIQKSSAVNSVNTCNSTSPSLFSHQCKIIGPKSKKMSNQNNKENSDMISISSDESNSPKIKNTKFKRILVDDEEDDFETNNQDTVNKNRKSTSSKQDDSFEMIRLKYSSNSPQPGPSNRLISPNLDMDEVIDLSGIPSYDSATSKLEESLNKLKSSPVKIPVSLNKTETNNKPKGKFTFKKPVTDLNLLSKRVEITTRVILPGQIVDPKFLNPDFGSNSIANSSFVDEVKPPKSKVDLTSNIQNKSEHRNISVTQLQTPIHHKKNVTYGQTATEIITKSFHLSLPKPSKDSNDTSKSSIIKPKEQTRKKIKEAEKPLRTASPPPRTNIKTYVDTIIKSNHVNGALHADNEKNKTDLDYCIKAKLGLLEYVFELCSELPIVAWKMVDSFDLNTWIKLKQAVAQLDKKVKTLNFEIKKSTDNTFENYEVIQSEQFINNVSSSNAGTSNGNTQDSGYKSNLSSKPTSPNSQGIPSSPPEIIPETQLDDDDDIDDLMNNIQESRLLDMGRGSLLAKTPIGHIDLNSPSTSSAKPFNPRVNLSSDHLPTATSSKNSVNIEDSQESTDDLDDDGWQKFNIEDITDSDCSEKGFNRAKPNVNAQADPRKRKIVDEIPELGSVTAKTSIKLGRFHAGVKNDGLNREFDGYSFPHSDDLKHVFRNKFGLKEFRPNQLQAINATMLGHDCFVLMPTGGGKSLCYQLPAVLTSGVTIVVSPLRSLIMDQTSKLNSLDINAAHVSGDVSLAESRIIYNDLESRDPKLKLLYVTPEKIGASDKFKSVLNRLYQNKKLARFVIDEVHCVSQWGHDFRPDYKKLNLLRQNFPGVPIMALTATANPRVRMDVLQQLNINKQCKWYLCSFNRPNLKYIVCPKKGATTLTEIINLIRTKFSRASGIVYCLSRNDCDQTASKLASAGLSAGSYHAGLSDMQREKIQKDWITDRIRIVCATIAFGMGIDKPDVRFVFHYSLPKSIEGYYQESGRAGRDGEVATCILYYNYSDVQRYKKMMDQDHSMSYEAKQIHLNNLNRMVSYCENLTDCRRQQQLEYFAEHFTREECLANRPTACDNCLKQDDYKIIDATEDCMAAARCVKDLCSGNGYGSRFTLLHIAEVLKGSNIKKITDNQHQRNPAYGRLKSWDKNDINRLLHKMVIDQYLKEELIFSNDIPQAYARIGPKIEILMSRQVKVEFPVTLKAAASKVQKVEIAAVDESLQNEELKELSRKCYQDLVKICQDTANEKNVPLSSVMKIEALKEMSVKLPTSEIEMLQLQYVTKANFDKYGQMLLDILQRYAAEKIVVMEELANQNTISEFESDGTDWSGLARDAASTSSSRGGKRRGTWRSGNKGAKRYKRTKSKSSPKAKQRSGLTSRGSFKQIAAKSRPNFNPCPFPK